MSIPGRPAARGVVALVAAGVLAGCAGVPGPVAAPLDIAPLSPTPTLPAASVAPAPTATAVSTVRAPRITGVLNFRDVAGWKTSLRLADGSTMARGVVYRSGRLKDLTKADRAELVKAGITDIVDLRTTQVARRTPDPAIKGAEYHHINLFGVYSTGSPTYISAAKAIAARKKMNRSFVTDAVQRRRAGYVLKVIARAEGPVVIHCTAGKDRTGWISALLQLTAGASTKDVIAEYLVSNELRKDVIKARYAKVRKARGTKAADIDRLLYIVDDSYLQAGLDELTKRYGDIDTFLSQGLRLSNKDIAQLRARLRGE